MTGYLPEAMIADDIAGWLRANAQKSMLRFITCGSVDDGKSTLIGRLLFDTRQIFDDQLSALQADSVRVGTRGEGIDFALLVDGLAAEREQGITIDVAYRFFVTPTRKFIIADTPGHEQYTRNMVTGASTADAAVILVDARKGLLTQTRRHSLLTKLLGVRHRILAVNKMDLVDDSADAFHAIVADYRIFAAEAGLSDIIVIPVSGVRGDNIVDRSATMDWYTGPTLLEALEALDVDSDAASRGPFRMPVQLVHRPDQHFRGFAGLVSGGIVAPGDAVRILPSGATSSIARIVTMDGDLPAATAGQSVTVTLADEIDCARGDVIVAAADPPVVADRFEASIVWLDADPLVPGRTYSLKLATQSVGATLAAPKYELNVNTMEHLAARTLELNAIGVAELATDRPIVFAPYAEDKALGGFILIDRVTNATVACGMIHFALRRATNIHWQAMSVDRAARARLKNQRPAVVWLTGLSGAGKSTIANLVEKKLNRMNRHSFLLDGDNVRHGLNKDLGFTETDRIENIRRVGEIARLMSDAGLIVVTAFISPFRAERDMVRAMIPAGEFLEVFIDTPLAEAERRDVKGLYAKARAGQLKNFTGIDSPYEAPRHPELRIDTTTLSAEAAADLIVDALLDLGT
ncbi:sulfate adenylyltransferase subunit CysN [Sphingomonas sp. RB1R13]|uniref:sulfate adenylyltransferase subunit CysN n=1 Tax=Sphingomonas sp. RB1R13 TaxID=3096159 RepID=UPI002FC88D1F